MTLVSESYTINQLHFSGAGFWYVCHANLGSDSSGTRFLRRLEHCSILSQKLVNHNCLCCHVFSCCNLITNYEFILYVTFNHIYFWRIWYKKPTPENGVDLWRRFQEHMSWVSDTRVIQQHIVTNGFSFSCHLVQLRLSHLICKV